MGFGIKIEANIADHLIVVSFATISHSVIFSFRNILRQQQFSVSDSVLTSEPTTIIKRLSLMKANQLQCICSSKTVRFGTEGKYECNQILKLGTTDRMNLRAP